MLLLCDPNDGGSLDLMWNNGLANSEIEFTSLTVDNGIETVLIEGYVSL